MASKTKHSGVYYLKNRNKWLVSFNVNKKARSFGRYSTYEEAERRARDVYPTLPIAIRKHITCDHCGTQGGIPNEFHSHDRNMCRECKVYRRTEHWHVWCKSQMVLLRKVQRKSERATPWSKWAEQKASILSTRGRHMIVQKNTSERKHVVTWDTWCVFAKSTIQRRTADRERTGWDKKTKTWAHSLTRRERLLVKQN